MISSNDGGEIRQRARSAASRAGRGTGRGGDFQHLPALRKELGVPREVVDTQRGVAAKGAPISTDGHHEIVGPMTVRRGYHPHGVHADVHA